MNTHYKLQGHALQLANAFGFLFPGEVCLIQALARSLPDDSTLVCIGVGTGTGSLAMAEIAPKSNIYSVDISEGGPFGGFSNEKNAFDSAGICPYPTQILGNSQIVHNKWEEISHNSSIDLLFIDGDHAAQALQGDIDGWVKFVKPGGYVLYHDYGSTHWGDVQKVVDQNMRGKKSPWREVLAVDTIVAFQRIA